MLKFTQFMFILFFSATIVSCGKTSEQKTQDRASTLVAEHNAVVQQINSSGTPSEFWSDSQIADFEKKIDRLEYLEAELAKVDSKDGVTIIGGNNDRIIREARQRIADARAAKFAKSQKNSKHKEEDQGHKHSEANPKIKRYNFLREEATFYVAFLVDQKKPNITWSKEELNKRKTVILTLKENLNERILLLLELRHQVSDVESKIANLKKGKEGLDEMLVEVNLILSQK